MFRSPHYLLGRFRVVRTAYGKAHGLRQFWSVPARTLAVGEHYGSIGEPAVLAASGLVTSVHDTRTHRRNLMRDAYSSGLALTLEAQASIVAAARELPLSENGTRLDSLSALLAPNAAPQRVAIATVDGSSKVGAIRRLAVDPLLCDVVAAYLGYFPGRVSSWLFWSPRNDLSDAEREQRYQTVRFHYDVHGFNFLYVNFYLFDTDHESGAHVLIRGSHAQKKARHLLGSAKLEEDQALRDYGAARIVVINGAAGAGFFEDTSCYHKALPPRSRERLMLQLRYQ